MPIDPSIVMGLRPLQLPDFAEAYQHGQQMRTQREAADALAADRNAQAELHQQQAAAAAREQAESSALTQLFGSGQPVAPPDIYRIVGPKRGADILKGLLDLQTANLKSDDDVRASQARRVAAIASLPESLRADAYKRAADDYVQRGLMKPEDIPAYSPEVLQHYVTTLLTPDKQYDLAHPKPIDHDPTHELRNPLTGEVIAAAKPKELTKPSSAQEFEYRNSLPPDQQAAYDKYQTEDANRRRPVTNITTANAASDVKEAVAGMKDGTIPPQLPGRASKEYTSMMAEAHRQGYDLQAAVTDWNATQKHISAMNSNQQLRLNQSINALPEMLDSVDALAAKWKAGRFPLLNKASLAAAKQGMFGKDAATIANQLDAQIADVTSDLGAVYMGGNSPTDHSLGLAAKSLSADWDEKVLHDMVSLARKNVQIRSNSIKQTGVAGASANNPYGGQPPAAAPAQTGATPERRPIPGIPGGMAELRNGKWIRVQ